MKDPYRPNYDCYEDARWSYSDGRFWSFDACAESILARNSVYDTKLERSGIKQDKHKDNRNKPEIKENLRNRSRIRNLQSNQIENDKNTKISSNGKACIFPFQYAQNTYTACTLTDTETGKPWCATGLDQDGFVLDDDWGDCIENIEVEYNAERLINNHIFKYE